MQDRNPIPPFDQTDTPGNICIADGHGIKIRVERRHLIVEDGVGTSRRERRFHKATTSLSRLIILGTTGYVSFEATRCLADAAIPMAQIDPEGRLLASSYPLGSDRAALRRAQAWALTNDTGLAVVRYLLDRKLEGQAHIAEMLGCDRSGIDTARFRLEEVDTLNELLWLEATAANHYWYAWNEVQAQFIKRHQPRVPEHWRTFETRGSGFSASGPRGAANPINAILNYLYALLEAETVFACHTVGLDPGIGILHADQRSRDSLALDLMEPVRPLVDDWVLRLLEEHRFRASDFSDTRRGICRLKPEISHWLAETTSVWSEAVGPHVEHVAKMLADTPDIRIDRIPTPPTGKNRSASRPPRPRKVTPQSAAPALCHTCGAAAQPGRTQCDMCLPGAQADHLQEMVSVAHDRLRELRQQGIDPAHSGEASLKRGSANRTHQKAVHRWNQENERQSLEVFSEEILPGLQDVSLSAMVEVTGLSKGYCSFIKRGIKIPHERHWDSLEQLAHANIERV